MLNTAVSLGRNNLDVSLITELGDDDTSKMITSFLVDNNVVANYIKLYNNSNTTLALAFLDDNKKPKYTFIKNYPKTRKLAQLPEFKEEDILLFGSLYSLDKEIRNNILTVVNHAKKSKATIIYDPNIRNAHHLQDQNIMDALMHNIRLSNIIKGSDEDFTNIFGNSDTSVQISELRRINNNALIIITLGADGVIADYRGQLINLPAIKAKVVSTIGAGDAFNAGIIFALNKLRKNNYELDSIISANLDNILTSGLQFASQVCNSMDNYINRTPH